MRIDCAHGYFRFSETAPGQLARFTSRYGFELARARGGEWFTFADLLEAPDYSIAGGTFLGAPTAVTFEGDPSEVMRQNGLVYNFALGLVVPLASIVQSAPISAAGDVFVSTGMILPGTVTDDGSRVTDYAAFYLHDQGRFKYSEIDYA